MAGIGGRESRKEELLQEANDIGDILKKLKLPREKYADRGNRGGGRGDGGRGGICSGMGRERGRRRQRGGGHGRGRGTGQVQNQDSKHLEHSVSPQQKPNKQLYLQDDWRYREPYQGRQETGRDLWQDEIEVGDTLGGQGGARRYHRNNNDNREQVGLSSDRQVEPHQLVIALTGQPSFSASLLQLMEQQQLTPAAVRATVSRYDLVFCLDGEEVQLRPQLDICAAHCEPGGCQDRTSCTNLHICPKMAVDKCDAGQDCVMGHHWHTNHNLKVLKSLYLDHLQYKVLSHLLQLLYGTEGQGQIPLDICAAYNQSSCSQTDCQRLHVCISFVTGWAQCSSTDCQLNHNLLSLSCCHLLKLHGLPTNESPRDIVTMLLQANPSLKNNSDQPKETKQKPTSPVSSNNHKDENGTIMSLENKKHSNTGKTSENNYDDQSLKEGTDNNPISDKDEKKPFKKTESSKITSNSSSNIIKSNNDESTNAEDDSNYIHSQPTPRPRTLWSHYLQGDVSTSAICYHSVEGKCKLEAIGCPLLHASQHFHWQVRRKSDRWMNLRPTQVICIERAFCDPSQNGVDLPRLDPATLEMSASGLLILLGRDVWHANFPDNQNFTLSNPTKTVILELRRLCTLVSPGQPIAPANFVWYFLDGNLKWVKYGNVDTMGRKRLVSNITSDGIEKHFQSSPSQLLYFKNSKFTYTLDLQTMKQRNKQTKVSRSVRRRPEPHLPNEEEDGKSSKHGKVYLGLPKEWETMQPEERLRMVTLAPTSSEYQATVGLLGGRASSYVVLKVERIQNSFLWRAFQNKVKELTSVYKDASNVDVRQLFHGTTSNVISNICTENLDWRLHGSTSGQSFGQGTYFSTDASYSYGYCHADSKGLKYMFVVRVAVGSKTLGNSRMVRPPTNPATSVPYDSTTNASGTIIVKYDKQEYYPEYLLSFL